VEAHLEGMAKPVETYEKSQVILLRPISQGDSAE